MNIFELCQYVFVLCALQHTGDRDEASHRGHQEVWEPQAVRHRRNRDDIAGFVRQGKDVQVVDAKTGQDLTRVTLTQVIMEDANQFIT